MQCYAVVFQAFCILCVSTPPGHYVSIYTFRAVFLLLQVAKDSALQFCPTANITAYHDSVMKLVTFFFCFLHFTYDSTLFEVFLLIR